MNSAALIQSMKWMHDREPSWQALADFLADFGP